MNLEDFNFYLPEELIAQYPEQLRSSSRLMHMDALGSIEHLNFDALISLFNEGDLLVRNNVRVMKARLFGEKSSGGKLEFLIERVIDHQRVLSQIKASKAPRVGDTVYMATCPCEILSKKDGFYELKLALEESGLNSIEALLEQQGHIPLPPYIKRSDEHFDEERYQTIYAKKSGAVAAPTAGLHFEQKHFDLLKEKGVDLAELTLFVGSGTFQPVRASNIFEHKMHSERFEIETQTMDAIKKCKHNGKRVIAVGTTTLRVLEAVSQQKDAIQQSGETDIFIYPGYQFKCVDALLTNFHLPKSSLLMLVSAFSGKKNIERAYQSAVEERYRFFSYGDAMFLERAK